MFDVQTFKTLFLFNVGYFRALVKDFPEESLDAVAVPGGNSARWIMGHVATAHDFTLRLLGREPVCPPAFNEFFSPQTAAPAGVQPPTKAEILAVFDRAAAAIEHALAEPLPPGLDGPHGLEFLAKTSIKTQADLLGHLLTTHFATHLGQLSTLRRLAGHPPLF